MSKPPSEVLARNVLRDLASPAYHFEGGLLERTAKEQGGFAVMVPARRQLYQLPMGLAAFFGITCERNANESHHFHPHQVEVYLVMKGAHALVVPPGSCHHLTEWIEPGVAYVVRSPNDITGEPAKILCDESKHFQSEDGIPLKAA
jgi:hypothetical protein